MSQLVKLEKRFENAFEKLEIALANKNVREVSKTYNEKKKLIKESHHDVDDLLDKIDYLKNSAKNDAKEIDKLVMKLKEILEADND